LLHLITEEGDRPPLSGEEKGGKTEKQPIDVVIPNVKMKGKKSNRSARYINVRSTPSAGTKKKKKKPKIGPGGPAEP